MSIVLNLDRWLEEIAPRRWAEDWDNVGLQVGTLDRRVDKVMLSLDVTESVVESHCYWLPDDYCSSSPDFSSTTIVAY